MELEVESRGTESAMLVEEEVIGTLLNIMVGRISMVAELRRTRSSAHKEVLVLVRFCMQFLLHRTLYLIFRMVDRTTGRGGRSRVDMM